MKKEEKTQLKKDLMGMLELIQTNLYQITILLALQSTDPEVKKVGERLKFQITK